MKQEVHGMRHPDECIHKEKSADAKVEDLTVNIRLTFVL